MKNKASEGKDRKVANLFKRKPQCSEERKFFDQAENAVHDLVEEIVGF
jgi:hypothetical protein